MIEGLFIFGIILMIPTAILALILQVMPNKRFLFTACSIILFVYLWQSHTLTESNDDDWGFGWLAINFIFTGCVLSAFIRATVLFRRWKKQEERETFWSWKESTLIGLLLSLLIGTYSFNTSDICIREKRKLSDVEIASHFLSENTKYTKINGEQPKPQYSGYYQLAKENKRNRGFMGTYRRGISFIYSPSYESTYSSHSTTINACGKRVGHVFKEGGFTEMEIEKRIQYYNKPN